MSHKKQKVLMTYGGGSIKKNGVYDEVKKAYDELISNITAKYIFLSYNDEGLMSLDDIKEIMSKRWEYWFFTMWYNRFKADKSENRDFKKDKVIEYLHYVKIV